MAATAQLTATSLEGISSLNVSVVDYQIEGSSSHSASYYPQHIKVNKPQDQSSRWSSGSNNQMQFITLKLENVAIATSITFGKYHKVHVCNLKEFKVYGGLDLDNMSELLHAGLRNDSEPETFALKHTANGVKVPCRYIKIVPLLAWGANFNFSIWFVEIRGIVETELVQNYYSQFMNYREREAVRLCLKHFRQRNQLELFNDVQSKLGMELEHRLLTELHSKLVLNGDFDGAEALMTEALEQNLFEEYISELKYKPKWNRVVPTSTSSPTPCMRGGHQMCIDPEDGMIYLFGGWDGTKDLSDFWSFSIQQRVWKCISMDTRKQGGPEPRSCHKICFDPYHKSIYTLGKYVDPDSRPNIPLDSDFWKFDIIAQKWTKLSTNTASEGGPDLIYDHQMVVDSEKSTIYVFGGRSISPDPTLITYSGLYSYNTLSGQWRLIRADSNDHSSTTPSASGVGTTSSSAIGSSLKSRIGHSMLFNNQSREIYIFAGQRHKDFLADFYIYNVENDSVIEVNRDYSKSGGPDAGFTQRATMDVGLGEFYVLSGLMREKNSLSETKNAFWVYSIKRNKWIKVYENDNVGQEYWSQMGDTEPRPRFAHQLVYDPVRKCQYLFGGNPGETSQPNLRLDDFWELYLTRPTPQVVLRKAMFLIRKQKFCELCKTGSKQDALKYLQTSVSALVDHDDPVESKEFRELVLFLFTWNPKKDIRSVATTITSSNSNGNQDSSSDLFSLRIALYESLLSYFPEAMREPKANLIDLIPMI